MDHLRRFWSIGLIAVIIFAFTAIPGTTAPTPPAKKFSVGGPLSVSATDTTIPVTIKNETPNGNSNINSLTISVDAASGVTFTGTVSPGSGVLSNSDRTISITNITSIKPTKFTTFQLGVDLPDPSCTASINWDATAFTGNSLNGDPFAIQPGAPVIEGMDLSRTTSFDATCGLSFDPAPSSGVVGDGGVSTTVKVTGGTYAGDITLAFTLFPAGATVTGDGTVQASGGQASFTLTGSKAGLYEVQASADGFDPITASFTIFEGDFACSATKTAQDEAGNEVNITRGATNLNNVACTEKPYSLSYSNNEVTFLYDDATQKSYYTVVIEWAAVLAGTPPQDNWTEIDVPSGTLHDMLWCLPDDTDTGSNPDLPGTEAGCIVTQTWDVYSSTQVQLTETIYLEADVIISKRK